MYKVCQEGSAIHWEEDTYVKFHLYNHNYLCPKSNSYGDNCEIIVQNENYYILIAKYVLNGEKFVVPVMVTPALNIT